MTMWIALCALFLVSVVYVFYHRHVRKTTLRFTFPYPPGPKPLPIFGNVRDLTTKELWLRADKWAKEFGGYPWGFRSFTLCLSSDWYNHTDY